MPNAGYPLYLYPTIKTAMKNRLILGWLLLAAAAPVFAQDFPLQSPGKVNQITVHVADHLSISIAHKGQPVTDHSPASITIDGQTLGERPKVQKSGTRSVNEQIHPTVQIKRAEISDVYNELTIQFQGNYSLVCRAYDDGVAYRFVTAINKEVTVNKEEVAFHFVKDFPGEFPMEDSYFSHSERVYFHKDISAFPTDSVCSMPAMVNLDNGMRAVITEADLWDYPGMYLTGSGVKGHLKTAFPQYVKEEKQTSDRDVMPVAREDFLARTNGARSFPWRVMILTDHDRELLENELIYKLAAPNQLKETGWIKPGKVAWDWYNANNLYGVDFVSGVNTPTYEYYIDFASTYGLEYIILDEGWYDIKTSDLLHAVPEIDLERLVEHGRQKNVGIILWVTWKALEDHMDAALDQFKKWGVKGIKVDFMQRDDQWMVNYYKRVAMKAAERHLLVDFHGAYKPTGLHRTYPNVISYEGVRGLEWSKWSRQAEPEHNLQIPFLRMLAGPMDYTPGAMRNATQRTFAPFFPLPSALGTRCHQLGMYVIFESPLQMLADSPSNYLRNAECMEFLGPVPSVWDETRVIDARYGDYALTARRSGADWFAGGMTDWTGREFTLDLSFLGDGVYEATIFQDGVNADKMAEDYKKVVLKVRSQDSLEVKMAPGGGWVARFRKL